MKKIQRTWVIGLSFATVLVSSAWADIYKYVDENGVMHISNVKPKKDKGFAVYQRGCYTSPGGCKKAQTRKYKGVYDDWRNMPLKWQPYADLVQQAANKHGVDPALIRSIMHAESAFDHKAISSAGAQGLMQLMPATQQRFGVTNPYDAAQNIDGGTRYLKILSKMFNGDVELICAAYNAGEGAVKKYKGIPPYSETQLYVKRVTNLYKRYIEGKTS